MAEVGSRVTEGSVWESLEYVEDNMYLNLAELQPRLNR